jgi:hypothetical protein
MPIALAVESPRVTDKLARLEEQVEEWPAEQLEAQADGRVAVGMQGRDFVGDRQRDEAGTCFRSSPLPGA